VALEAALAQGGIAAAMTLQAVPVSLEVGMGVRERTGGHLREGGGGEQREERR